MLKKYLLELSNTITISPSENPEEFCRQIKSISNKVPMDVAKSLLEFSHHGSQTGFLLFDGFSIEDTTHMKTPYNNNEKIGETTNLAKIQGILISTIGELVAYEAEGHGKLFQDIIPMKSMEKKQMSLSSGAELEIHTEQAFSKLRPDILSLACIRGDPDAFTYILPVKSIIKNLSHSEIELLRKPLWMTSVDFSFKLCGQEFIEGDVRGPMPIISGPEEDPRLLFDQDLMSGITEEAHQMIAKIVDIYYTHRIRHNLIPGQIIFIDNNRAVHGRSPFSPKYDGTDRFLVRCFATFDYKKSAYARNSGSRMIHAIYS
uniref:TauD/TfdA-like domain-containing protein n=1 Tax=viral metagenome TaxID=1070528 RepID=A0A6C0D7B5_9ZZZZ